MPLNVPHPAARPLPRTQQAGVGLIDVLVALLLLSIALLAAGAAALQGLQSGQAAALQMRVADLIADLDEDLAAAAVLGTEPRASIAGWQLRVAEELPAGVTDTGPHAVPDSALPAIAATLLWRAPAATGLLSVPIALAATAVGP